MNETARDGLGNAPALELLESLGGMPLLQGSPNPHNWSSLQAETVMAGLGGGGLIVAVYVGVDARNNTERVVTLDQPELGLSREFYEAEDGELAAAFLSLMVETAVYLGSDRPAAEAGMGKVLELEKALALASDSQENRRDYDALYNPTTLDQLPTGPGHPPDWKVVHLFC